MLAQLSILTRKVLFLGGFFDGTQELGLLYRFGDEVVSAFLDGFDGDLDRAVAGDHDDFEILLDGFRPLQQFDAIHDRQTKIGNQDIDVLFVENVERLLSVVGLEHIVFGGLENLHHSDAIFRVVFNDKECGCFSYRHSGNSIENVAPLPAWLSTTRCPLCSKMICCDVASPNPVPCALVVKNGSKSFG